MSMHLARMRPRDAEGSGSREIMMKIMYRERRTLDELEARHMKEETSSQRCAEARTPNLEE